MITRENIVYMMPTITKSACTFTENLTFYARAKAGFGQFVIFEIRDSRFVLQDSCFRIYGSDFWPLSSGYMEW